jgi:hypothetical protein
VGRGKGGEKSPSVPCHFRAVNAELDRISRVRCHLPLANYVKLRWSAHSNPTAPTISHRIRHFGDLRSAAQPPIPLKQSASGIDCVGVYCVEVSRTVSGNYSVNCPEVTWYFLPRRRKLCVLRDFDAESQSLVMART